MKAHLHNLQCRATLRIIAKTAPGEGYTCIIITEKWHHYLCSSSSTVCFLFDELMRPMNERTSGQRR